MFRLFHPAIFVLAVSLLTYTNVAADHSADVCASNGGYPTTIPSITSTGLVSTSNSNCVNVYSVNLANSKYHNKYVLIQLNIKDYPTDTSKYAFTPYLIGKTGSTPGIDNTYSSDNPNNADSSDLSGYTQHKSYQYISIDKSASAGTYYIAFYRYANSKADYYSKSVTYSISVTGSDTYQCPNDCNSATGNGKCDQANQKCVCNTGYFDSDCSVKATALNPLGSGSVSISSYNWIYYYLPVKDYGGALTLTFSTMTKQTVTCKWIVTDITSSTLPFMATSPFQFTLTSDSNSNDVGVPTSYPGSIQNPTYLFACQNLATDSSVRLNYNTSISVPSNSVSPLIPIIASVVTVIVILAIGLGIWRVSRLRAHRLRMQNLEALRAPAAGPAKIKLLSKEELDQYFPKVEYVKMNNNFQTACTVCIEDYQHENICRKLYCGHVFHDNCIEEWFGKNNTCPNCNKLMTVDAINEFTGNSPSEAPTSPTTLLALGSRQVSDAIPLNINVSPNKSSNKSPNKVHPASQSQFGGLTILPTIQSPQGKANVLDDSDSQIIISIPMFNSEDSKFTTPVPTPLADTQGQLKYPVNEDTSLHVQNPKQDQEHENSDIKDGNN